MTVEAPFVSRQERFTLVGSTNDVIRGWLAEGVPEVCLAVADEQSAGRGREDRSWTAPAGRALLLSVGFRPTWLPPERAWRLAASVSLAMAEAAEKVASLADRAIRLKWPNDLVVERDHGVVRKVGGVLGETAGLGTDDPRVVVGIGLNADWPASEFPSQLADSMTSLREIAGDRSVDLARLLEAFMSRLEVRVDALRAGRFDAGDHVGRQLTNGRLVRLEGRGGTSEVVQALRVDPVSGALVVEDTTAPSGERPVFSGEIRHLRLDEAV